MKNRIYECTFCFFVYLQTPINEYLYGLVCFAQSVYARIGRPTASLITQLEFLAVFHEKHPPPSLPRICGASRCRLFVFCIKQKEIFSLAEVICYRFLAYVQCSRQESLVCSPRFGKSGGNSPMRYLHWPALFAVGPFPCALGSWQFSKFLFIQALISFWVYRSSLLNSFSNREVNSTVCVIDRVLSRVH